MSTQGTVFFRFDSDKIGSVWWPLYEVSSGNVILEALEMPLSNRFEKENPSITEVMTLLKKNPDCIRINVRLLDSRVKPKRQINSGDKPVVKKLKASNWFGIGSGQEYLSCLEIKRNGISLKTKFKCISGMNESELLFSLAGEYVARLYLNEISDKNILKNGDKDALWH